MMKIKSVFLISCLILCIFTSGCAVQSGNTSAEESKSGSEVSSSEQSQMDSVVPESSDGSEDTGDDLSGEDFSGELLVPEMEWWELYNPNGYDTVTAVISNPNDVAIDVSYDLVFYKDGAEVSRIEWCDNFSILPGHEDLIWVNTDVPASEDADDVKMENVHVSKASSAPIDGSYEYAGIIDGKACFDFELDSKPTAYATIWFVLYNDENGNHQYDQGEIVVVDFASLMEQSGRVSFNPNVYSYTDFLVFFTAY